MSFVRFLAEMTLHQLELNVYDALEQKKMNSILSIRWRDLNYITKYHDLCWLEIITISNEHLYTRALSYVSRAAICSDFFRHRFFLAIMKDKGGKLVNKYQTLKLFRAFGHFKYTLSYMDTECLIDTMSTGIMPEKLIARTVRDVLSFSMILN